MNDELMRRISDALDAPGGIEGDAELRALLDADAEAAAYAEDLAGIDSALGALGAVGREPDWEALLGAIDARLDADEPLEDIGDPTLPPSLDGAAGPAEEDDPAVVAAAAVAAPVSPPPARGAAPVVDLASRRRTATWIAAVGGLAAAAAVALGITAGMGLGSDEAPMAAEAAPASVAPEPSSGIEALAAAEVPAAAPAPLEEMADRQEAFAADGWEAAGAEVEAEPEASAMGALAGPMAREQRMASSSGSTAGADGLLQNAYAIGGGGAGSGGAGASRGAPAPRRMAPGAPPAEVELDARSAQQALASVTDRVRRCMGGVNEVARVRVTVRGSDGSVGAVTVEPPFAGTPAEACIATAVRSVQMPRSAEPSYSIGYPFRPAPIAGSSGDAPAAARVRARRARSSRSATETRPAAIVDSPAF